MFLSINWFYTKLLYVLFEFMCHNWFYIHKIISAQIFDHQVCMFINKTYKIIWMYITYILLYCIYCGDLLKKEIYLNTPSWARFLIIIILLLKYFIQFWNGLIWCFLKLRYSLYWPRWSLLMFERKILMFVTPISLSPGSQFKIWIIKNTIQLYRSEHYNNFLWKLCTLCF